MKKIAYIVYGDLMTAKELLPVAKVLEAMGFIVTHIVDKSELERATLVLDEEGII